MPGLATPAMDPKGKSKVKAEDVDGEQGAFMNDDDDDASSAYDEYTYKPRPQLSQPSVIMRTLAHLMNGLEQGNIDVDPEYQREVVWTADRMTGLINSLMENYYIPPIILNKKRSQQDRSKTSLVCVDGKQRLSSVRAFIKGMIPCHDHRGEKWWFCNPNPNGKARRVLPEETQKQFLAKEFVSFEFANLSQEQEEDLFARVQMGVQLTMAEKMRASTGPWQELAKLFVEDFPEVFNLLKDQARGKDFQMALSCFSQVLEVQHPSNANGKPMLKTTHSFLPKMVANHAAVDDGTKSHLASIFSLFKELIEEDPNAFTNVERKLKGVQTFAPIEMVAVAVLLSMYSDSRNNKLLLGDIRAMRNELREHFVDLRMNHQVWRWLWEWIDNLENFRGAVDGSTIRRKQAAGPSATQSPTKPPTPAIQKSRKRPRLASDTVPMKQELEEVSPFPPFPTSAPRTHPTIQAAAHRTTSEVNSFRAPTASMVFTAAGMPSSREPAATPIRTSSRANVRGRTAPQSPNYAENRIQELLNSLAASSRSPPTNIARGTSHNLTPLTESFKTESSAFQPLNDSVNQNPTYLRLRKGGTNGTSEIEDVIDLTSDTEQERQDLLSSFGGRTTSK